METLYEWGIPSIVYLIGVVLIFTLIPPIMRRLKGKAEQTHHTFDDILASVLTTPLILFFLGLGLSFYLDAIPDLPKNWVKYSDAIFIFLFVLTGYLFVDRLMMEILRRSSKKVAF